MDAITLPTLPGGTEDEAIDIWTPSTRAVDHDAKSIIAGGSENQASPGPVVTDRDRLKPILNVLKTPRPDAQLGTGARLLTERV